MSTQTESFHYRNGVNEFVLYKGAHLYALYYTDGPLLAAGTPAMVNQMIERSRTTRITEVKDSESFQINGTGMNAVAHNLEEIVASV